jgi:hypothetical protein
MNSKPIALTEEELEDLLTKAAKKGSREFAVAILGIDEGDTSLRKDLTELRDLLDAYRALRKGALYSLGRLVGYGILFGLGALALALTTGSWHPLKSLTP